MYVFIYVCMHVSLSKYIYTRLVYVCVHACAGVCMSTRACVLTYIYVNK